MRVFCTGLMIVGLFRYFLLQCATLFNGSTRSRTGSRSVMRIFFARRRTISIQNRSGLSKKSDLARAF